MEIRPVDGSFVGEAIGVDITADDVGDLVPELQAAADEYGVLVIRDTAQDNDAFASFAEQFGVLQPSHYPQAPVVYAVSNLDEDGKVIALESAKRALGMTRRIWHVDHSFARPGIRYTILAARTLPPEGGGTQFRDMRLAYAALPAELKAKIDGLCVVHDFERHFVVAGQQMSPETRAQYPAIEHPLVLTHPRTGRKAILTGIHASHIVGMPVEEGRRLIEQLDAHADQAAFLYTHTWRPGDIAMWDNRSVQHRQMPWDDQTYPRVMQRTAISDVDVPAPVAAH